MATELSSPLRLSVCSCRYRLLRHSKERQKVDGLNNLNYSPLVSRRPLYTNITVTLSRKLAPVADYWRRHSWTAKHLGIKVLWDISHISPVAALLKDFFHLVDTLICFFYLYAKKETKVSLLDKSYKKDLRINAALACATVHHSAHLGLSVSTCLLHHFGLQHPFTHSFS